MDPISLIAFVSIAIYRKNMLFVNVNSYYLFYIIINLKICISFQYNLNESRFGSSTIFLHIWIVIPMYYVYGNEIIIIVIIIVNNA